MCELGAEVELTDIAEEDGQEDEAMEHAKDDDADVHAEVEDDEYLWVSECQYRYADDLSQRNTAQHL